MKADLDTTARLTQSRARIAQALAMAGAPSGQPWWGKSRWPLALTMADKAARALLQPSAQRHPYSVVAGAAAVGALVVLARPWRWISTPVLLAGVLPKILSEVLKDSPAPAHARAPDKL